MIGVEFHRQKKGKKQIKAFQKMFLVRVSFFKMPPQDLTNCKGSSNYTKNFFRAFDN